MFNKHYVYYTYIMAIQTARAEKSTTWLALHFGGGAVGYVEEIGEGFVASPGVALGSAADLVFQGIVVAEAVGFSG
ncbi:MAG: hypothetical protein NTY45_10225 [Elusimicrobia bacterium]|nr:hypothetical protein [Elusimicrobiota bacterium]